MPERKAWEVHADDFDKEEEAEVPEEKIDVDPLLQLLQKRFEYTSETFEDKDGIQQSIIAEVEKHDMADYWLLLSDCFGWKVDDAKLKAMQQRTEKKLAELDEQRKEAEEQGGDEEVRGVVMQKCDIYARVGDKESTVKANREAIGIGKVGLGPKLDFEFQRIRLGLAFNDNDLIQEGLDASHELLKTEGDWERRNRLKVYEGVFLVSKRQFKKGADLLLDALCAFSAPELVSYKDFIFYTVVVAMVVLDRTALHKKILTSSEVLQMWPELPNLKRLVHSLYDCKYIEFFPALGAVCEEMLGRVVTAPHVNYFYREMRLIAFKQFLQSYRSVTLQSMAEAFAIPIESLDNQLCIFIASGRLTAKIDKVSGSVETAQTDSRSYQFHKLLSEGDMLLNRIQRLARVAER
eukprot:TRINITY_DN37051_c0_g1_i1.p1 TRINITY_DN37051_c0_g1~~TRINITY_DN37051_c0_g1_i1.p1  ORF type:complete len:407 (+),score=181.44 TRINITY_DN37051_c0_g1_i1:75-1295(+)